MAKKIVAPLALMVVAFLLGGCLGESSPSSSAVAQAAEPAAGPKGLQKAALTPPAEPRTEAAPSSDGKKYATWKCRLPEVARDFYCHKNLTPGRTWAWYTGGDDDILKWYVAKNGDDFMPPGTTHKTEIPTGVSYAAKPKDGNFKLP